MGKFVKHFISFMIGLIYFATCSVYTVIVAETFEQIINLHHGIKWDIRIYIATLLVPMILICWIPTLKHLVVSIIRTHRNDFLIPFLFYNVSQSSR